MNNYKLTFRLKQHTPIIHFQHDQHGATLRASELKPKLDKFLIEKFIKEGTDYNNWLIKGQEKALDYKVRIESNSEEIKGIRDNKTYFGDMGNREEKKEYMWTDKIIDLSILVFDKYLADEIKKYFPTFLAETNFGTRQNKGNGSFYIDKLDSQNFVQIEKFLPSGTYYFSITQTDDKSIFQIIDYYYRRLKAGINMNFDSRCRGEYHKSYLYQFYNGITIKGWEKRYIKEKFFGLYDDKIDKYFIRALLGLPGSFTFKKTKEPCHKKADKKINSTYEIQDDYEIEVYHPDIERYKSPITFKPIKYEDKTKIFILTRKNEHINTTKEFVLYKKFIVKKIFKQDGRFRTKQQELPKRLGTMKTEIDSWINNLTIQENNMTDYLTEINKIQDYKKKNNLLRTVDNYIGSQKNRFEEYIKECTLKDNKYFPPKSEIEIPDFVLDLTELIKKYNEDELKKSFAFENITATIDVTK